ncbi:MAG TPA: hypothetical protein VHE30_07955 [Polyangiaceae bacterium]|nr:hypothetical protein [Polyangiaceae bacterium]
MNEEDPVRLALRGDVGSLDETLRAAEARVPDDATVARLASRLGLAPPGGSPSPAASSAPSGTAGLGVAGGKVLASALLVAGGIVLVVATRPTRVPPPATSASATPAVAASAEAVLVPPPIPVPSGASATDGVEQKPVERPPAAAEHGTAVRSPAPPTELELVGKAERAARTDPATALALAKELERLYPAGALSEERDVIAIEALARLGNLAAARERATAFSAAHPGSPYARRIQHAVGGGTISGSDGKKSGSPAH